MRVTEKLSTAFGSDFEKWIAEFALSKGLIPDIASLHSNRFVSRSIVPHIQRLSQLFNRYEKEQTEGLAPYWKESSNPSHLRLAYFLYFMPSNLYRVASVWAELQRLGFQWKPSSFQAIEFGAGPASGACGIAAGEKYAPVGLPDLGSWALIEQDKAILELGSSWAEHYFTQLEKSEWSIRPFHRKIELSQGFLPPKAPRFNLWLMSYTLNEFTHSAEELSSALIKSWSKHLDDEGLVILVEPALKLQSRKLLELRKALLEEKEFSQSGLQILLPCLGHQACGALKNPEDWCHEEVTWWRPPYFKKIDQMAGLDRKSLPFSYLVIAKSKRPRNEILPGISRGKPENRFRLVSPAHKEGRDLEFFLCGQEGKIRARFRPESEDQEVQRGDILLDAEVRGDVHSSRVEKMSRS